MAAPSGAQRHHRHVPQEEARGPNRAERCRRRRGNVPVGGSASVGGCGPDAAYARSILVDELAAALEELPIEQRDVFVAHEIDGRSFKELAEETGVRVNTLLARKHSAVRRLRKRLQAIYDEFK